MICVLFGLPGVGKSYIGEKLAGRLGAHLYDADDGLTREMRNAIARCGRLSDDLRSEFYEGLIREIHARSKAHRHLIVVQALLKDEVRQRLLSEFEDVRLIYVDSHPDIRSSRLAKRTGH